jgi:predicted glutamine amidotransferase
MCQLTFVNLKDKKYNGVFTYNQLIVNTEKDHKDGFGFYTKGLLYKTALCPQVISNYHEILKDVFSEEPVIAHVRKASWVNNKKTTVEDEKAHPFETDQLIFSHNGTLTPKDKDVIYEEENKDLIDSQIFLNMLDKLYNGTNLVEALQETMKSFTGPFAFLIYSKVEDKFFAVRGTTKLLHYSKAIIHEEEQGYVLNTELPCLETNIARFKTIISLTDEVPFHFIKPELLQSNSVFELTDEGIKRIGEVTENFPITQVITNTNWNTNQRNGKNTSNTLDKVFSEVSKLSTTLFQGDLEYLDEIAIQYLKKPLAYLDIEDFRRLKEILSTLKETPLNLNNFTNIWSRITMYEFGTEVHNKFKVPFPYLLADYEDLLDIYDKVRSLEV